MDVLRSVKNTALDDWHRADIIAALKKQGWSLRALANECGLSYSTLRSALEKPYPKMERIIASAIGVPPEIVWAKRFADRNYRPALTNKLNHN